jgi:transcriptional regulator with PAS, ATPase and Fis domain
MDSERHQNLHTIIMLKDIIRKWWRSELCFANRSGTVVNWKSREGLPRCGESIRVLHERFKASRKLRSAQLQDCHANLTVIGAPLYVNGEYQGFIFVEGAVNATEFEKLTDLLELGVSEIANYEAEVTKRDRMIRDPSSELSDRYRFDSLIGNSEPMLEVFRLLEKVCNSESMVLIYGESGTGKELVARAIHYHGPRRDKPFVVQNCSAFNDNLLETALFGHTRGSFTGALRDKKGLFEVADGGTFFLDEVGDMSPALQVKLLRVLQEGTFIPVGGTQLKKVDVRVIAATHKDLAQLVKQGTFREDLFYRINVIRIHIPPLRERRDDIPILIDHFIRKHQREGQRARSLAPEASRILAAYSWPGNIRELENEIERLLVLGSDLETIPAEIISSRIRQSVPEGTKLFFGRPDSGKLNEMVEKLEREAIHAGLVRTGYNKSRLARELGISRSNLILKIAKYGLDQGHTPSDTDETATA